MTFATNTIYKDLMKSVHPDLHPELLDATYKAQIVNSNKDNPLALRRLGIEWGFIIPTSEDFKTILQRKLHTRPSPIVDRTTVRPNIVLNVYDRVLFMSGRYVGNRGIIVEISPIRMGKYTSYRSFIVYVPSLDTFINTRIKEFQNVSSVLYFQGKIGTEEIFNVRNAWSIFKQNRAGSLTGFGLLPNKDYTDDRYHVKFKLNKMIFIKRLVRTTAKCIVVNMGESMKLVRLSNVIEVSR